jgi:hypothetical protein
LPRTGRIEIDIHVSADINISATVARRRVSRYVVSEIGNLLYGGEPTIVVGKRICWRVPVLLSYPHTGPVGEVGALDVDIETGEVLVTAEQVTEITERANYLAQRTLKAAE